MAMNKINSQVEYELSADSKTLTLKIKLVPGKVTEKHNVILATSGGNQTIEHGIKIGLNVYRPE